MPWPLETFRFLKRGRKFYLRNGEKGWDGKIKQADYIRFA